MEEVNWFDAYLRNDDSKVQFTIFVPGEISPASLGRALDLLFKNEVFFVGGSGDFESVESGGDPA